MNKAINKVYNLMNNNFSKRKFFLIYTAAFLIAAFFVLSWFIFSDKALVWEDDGWTQHSTALVYYGRFLRGIIRSLITEHRLVIPEWEFALGEGGDILNTLHYYVIGEPLNLLSALVPSRFAHYLYSCLMVFRLYLAGLSFSLLCGETAGKKPWAVLAGALTYAFSGWGLIYVCVHPFFLTPLIYFPLLILGVEKVIKNQKPYIFIASVALAAMTNFYFFYMQVMLVVIYCVVRCITLYKKDVKKIFFTLLRIAVPAVTAVLISGIILMPILKTFLGDSRMSTDHTWYLFYPLSYYSTMPSVLISENRPFFLIINLSAPAILCAALLFRKKNEDRLLKILLVMSFVFALVPIFGQIFNGLSYRSNRWIFSLALLYSFILVRKWDSFIALTKKDGKFLFVCTAAYFALCFICTKSIEAQVFCGICFLLMGILFFSFDWGKGRKSAIKEVFAVLIIIANVSANAFWAFSDYGCYYIKSQVENSKLSEEYLINETTAVKRYADDGFVRYSGRGLENNKGLLGGISSANFFWSISNPNIVEFRDKVSLNDKFADQFKGYDSRAALNAISAVNYFVTKAGDKLPVPYGFTKIDTMNVQSKRTKRYIKELENELGTSGLSEEQIKKIKKESNNSFDVYKNPNALPVGYCYGRSFTNDVWESMSALERQEAMLSAVYVSEADVKIPRVSEFKTDIRHVPFSVKCEDAEITYNSGGVVTTSPDKKLTFTFSGVPNAETYIQIKNLHFKGTPEYDLYFGGEEVDPLNLYSRTTWKLVESSRRHEIRRDKIYYEDPSTVQLDFYSSLCEGKKKFEHHTPDDTFAFGKTDYLVNIGYSETAANTIEINFPKQGVYSFDSIEIMCVPMEGYTAKVDALRADSLQNVKFGTNKVTGSLNASADEVLCVAIPYSDGWTAYVDGEETETFTANGQYIGLNVSKGEHTVELRYSRPWKNLGYASTALGMVILAAYIVFERIKKAKSK